ncbi:MAG: putative Ig domain-containing protein [Pseudomonadota bacterium]
MKTQIKGILLALVVFLGLQNFGQATEYEITLKDSFNGQQYSVLGNINNSGEVVGFCYDIGPSSLLNTVAYVWDMNLDIIYELPIENGYLCDLNDNGLSCGMLAPSNGDDGYIWNYRDNLIQYIGMDGNSINNINEVVGTGISDFNLSAQYYSETTGILEMGQSLNLDHYSHGLSINDNGYAIGYGDIYIAGKNKKKSFIYHKTEGERLLAEHPNYEDYIVAKINNIGNIIGSILYNGLKIPCYWQTADSIPTLIDLPQGFESGSCTAINGDGTIILGVMTSSEQTQSAFIYNVPEQEINELILNIDGLNIVGTYIGDINESGWITGYIDLDDGSRKGLLLTPIIPNSAPVFTQRQDITVKKKTLVAFTVEATDDDGDELTYSIDMADGSSVPSDVSFDSLSGSFSWKPGSAGLFRFLFKVTDGELTDEMFVTIEAVNGKVK